MKILVPIKRVIDPYVKIRVKPDESGVDTQHVKMAINPFDEIAIEAALQLQEQGQASEVILVSIGEAPCTETLRAGLALGAARAIWVEAPADLRSLATAKLLAAVAKCEDVGLVLLGKQAIDNDNSQVGQMLAGLLAWPQATFASRIDISGGEATVVREVDSGLETLKLQLPAVITTDLRLNTPRYATLPNIMKAKAKPLQNLTLQDFADLRLDSRQHIEKVVPPPVRKAGVKVANVAELVTALNQAGVL